MELYSTDQGVQILNTVENVICMLDDQIKTIQQMPPSMDTTMVGLDARLAGLIDSMLDDYRSALEIDKNVVLAVQVENMRDHVHTAFLQRRKIDTKMNGKSMSAEICAFPSAALPTIHDYLVEYLKMLRVVHKDAAKLVHH